MDKLNRGETRFTRKQRRFFAERQPSCDGPVALRARPVTELAFTNGSVPPLWNNLAAVGLGLYSFGLKSQARMPAPWPGMGMRGGPKILHRKPATPGLATLAERAGCGVSVWRRMR
jgi:hypothetical protein